MGLINASGRHRIVFLLAESSPLSFENTSIKDRTLHEHVSDANSSLAGSLPLSILLTQKMGEDPPDQAHFLDIIDLIYAHEIFRTL